MRQTISSAARIETYIIAPHIRLVQAEETISISAGLYHLFEHEVHPCVAGEQVPGEGIAVFELDEHRVADGGIEEAKGELVG
jgi:hypothetical protein